MTLYDTVSKTFHNKYEFRGLMRVIQNKKNDSYQKHEFENRFLADLDIFWNKKQIHQFLN
jgi:hypothetical protein